MLYKIVIEDGNIIFGTEEDYLEIKKTLDYMGIKFDAYIVSDKMYAIHWYDYIDEYWRVIWCTEEEYEEQLANVIEAEVEYYVEAYN